MGKKHVLYEKSGGRRLPLYAEVGKYFSPNGDFDEKAFRAHLESFLNALEEEFQERENRQQEITAKISEYLSQIIEYINEKGMESVSVLLFKAAVDECAGKGIAEISLPPDQFRALLSAQIADASKKDERKESGDDKRQKIFEAALKVFAIEGYHRATMDKIAQLSGVAKGSVYRYFPSKEELLDQLLVEKYREIVTHISQIYSKDDDVIKMVQEMIEFWVNFIADNHVLYRLIQNEALFPTSGNRVMFYDYLVSHLPMLKERIVSLNRKKKLKTTNFYTVFYGMLGFIDGVVHKWFRCGREYDLRDEIPIILEVLFNGFVGEISSSERYFVPPEDEQ